MRNRSKATRRRPILPVAVASAVLLMSACSSSTESSNTSSGANVAEASRVLEDLLRPLEFEAPGPEFEVSRQLTGEKLYFISAALGFEFTQLVLAGMEAAAEKTGMTIVALDAKGDISTASRQIEQAISQDAAAIAVMTFSVDSLAGPLKAAKAAGIPVLSVFDGDAGLPTREEVALGVVAKASFCYTCRGRQLAAMAVAQSSGNVNAALVGVPDSRAAVLQADGFKSELARLCPGCKVKDYGSSTAQWATQLPSIGTAIGQDPNINFVVPVFSTLGELMKPALLAAGAEGRLSILTANATKATMADLTKEELLTGIIGEPESWMGWAVMDQALRVLTGQAVVKDSKVGSRAFTSANVVDADPVAGASYGDVDFAAENIKLWGLGG